MNFLDTMAQHNCIALKQEALTWHEAVKLGCDLLEKNGFVTTQYYQGILDSTEKNGAYYVLIPGFAMPHARPECGVLKTGFSLVTLKEGVNFGSVNDPISTVITLAARSSEEMNEGAIVRVMEFLEDEGLMEKVRKAHHIEELFYERDGVGLVQNET